MKIIKEEKNDIFLLKIDGKLDAHSAPKVEIEISKAISDGSKKIMINMEKVNYISSAGLRVLLLAAKDIKEKKGKIVIYSMSDVVDKIFKISGFSTIFELCDTEAEAMKCF